MAAPMKLVNVPTSLDSLAWSEDNIIAVATGKCVNIFSLHCDPLELNGDFVFRKSIIPPSAKILKFDVGISMKKLNHGDKYHHLVLSLQTDRTLTLPRPSIVDVESDRNSFKLVRWSPVSSQILDRAFLACLATDHRLTIYEMKSKKSNFTMIVDLSLVLNKLLIQQRFAHSNEDPPPPLPSRPDVEAKCKEFKRRVHMLAAVTMDWSGILTTLESSTSEAEGLPSNETCPLGRKSFVLLAVAMKSGHVVLWKVKTSLENEADISLYSVFDSGYQWPASLSWYRLLPLQTTSNAIKAFLAVGDTEGRISLWSIQEGGESTLRSAFKCLDVWPDKDLMAVSNIAWMHSSSSSEVSEGSATLVATKGLFLMAFLIDLGTMTVLRKVHAPNQLTLQATSLCVSRNVVVTTCSSGAVSRAVIDWTKPDGVIKIDIFKSPAPNIKGFGIAVSPNGIFTACPSTFRQGKRKPYDKLLNFNTLGKMDAVVAELLDSKKNLSQKMDLLEYIRQTFISTGDRLPQELESIADGEFGSEAGLGVDEDRTYAFRLRLRRFMLLMRLCRAKNKDVDEEKEREELIHKVDSDIQETETQLTKLHIISALQSWQQITVATRNEESYETTGPGTIALLLMADWLSAHTEASEEPLRSLVTEVYKATRQSTEAGRRESCDLCGECIAFTSTTSDACPNGHGWMRCQLSLQLCQTTSIPRFCLHCDVLALPVQQESDSFWLRRVLQERCLLCESVFVPS